MSRIGGFPRFKRPVPLPAPAEPVAAAPAAVEQQDEQQAEPRTGFPRLPVRPVPPAPAQMKYDAPHATTRPAPPPLPAAEPVDDFFGEGDEDVDPYAPTTAGAGYPFAEPLEEDPDDAPEITVPLQPPPRPPPTVLYPARASRTAAPPVRPPGVGLMASRVGARPFPPPRDVPKPAPATLESRPMTSIKEVSWDHRFGTTPDVPVHKVELPPGWRERARPFVKPVPNPPDDIPFD
jgi:hypothetical protein